MDFGSSGSIHRNYDLLLRHLLHIVGEFQLLIHHCLLALPGVGKEYLTRVISHPQVLAQCELTLTGMGLNVARDAFDDTAGAAEYVAANGLRDTATIASAWATELYGLATPPPLALSPSPRSCASASTHDHESRCLRSLLLQLGLGIPRVHPKYPRLLDQARFLGLPVGFPIRRRLATTNLSAFQRR